jgi:hypothetical protein
MTNRAPDNFKNRVAAHRWLKAESIAVGQTKFYEDCEKLALVQPDKTIKLADLLAYIKAEHKTGPAGPSRDMGLADRQQKLDNLELRERELKVDKLEREKRAEDARWILKDDAFAQMAGIVGLLRDSLRHHAHRSAAAILHLAGGDPGRAAEVCEGIESEIFARAFNELAGAGRVEVMFESEEDG